MRKTKKELEDEIRKLKKDIRELRVDRSVSTIVGEKYGRKPDTSLIPFRGWRPPLSPAKQNIYNRLKEVYSAARKDARKKKTEIYGITPTQLSKVVNKKVNSVAQTLALLYQLGYCQRIRVGNNTYYAPFPPT